MKTIFFTARHALQALIQSVRSTSTTATDYTPLRLDLQFFADPPGDDPNDPPADPPDSDDDELTLADLLKTNPKIKAEYKAKVEAAVQKRFKNFDFDPEEARIALREKKERAEQGDTPPAVDPRIETLSKENGTLEEKLKDMSVAVYASENGLNPKLMTRLAKDQIKKLEFNDSYELDSEELEEIADNLRTEFPDVFKTAEVDTNTDDPGDDSAAPPPPPGRKSGYNPGDPKFNNPNTGKPDDKAEVAATLARLKKTKRI